MLGRPRAHLGTINRCLAVTASSNSPRALTGKISINNRGRDRPTDRLCHSPKGPPQCGLRTLRVLDAHQAAPLGLGRLHSVVRSSLLNRERHEHFRPRRPRPHRSGDQLDQFHQFVAENHLTGGRRDGLADPKALVRLQRGHCDGARPVFNEVEHATHEIGLLRCASARSLRDSAMPHWRVKRRRETHAP